MLESVSLRDLEVEDEESFSHVALYEKLKQCVSGLELRFLVPRSGALSWDTASYLNHTTWEPGHADVLCDRTIQADVVTHVAWHALADRALVPGVSADLLGESIASAFDIYLVGRLLGNRPNSPYLESQVPRMAEAAELAGQTPDEFEKLLGDVAGEPEVAFGELQSLLFRVSTQLVGVSSAQLASEILHEAAGQRFGPLLHHFELSTWVNRSKARNSLTEPVSAQARAAAQPTAEPAQPARQQDAADVKTPADEIAAALRGAPNAVDWLDQYWVKTALAAISAKP